MTDTAAIRARAEKADIELQQFFCREEPVMGFEGDTEGWTPEQSAIVLMRRLRADNNRLRAELASARAEVLKAAADIVEEERGTWDDSQANERVHVALGNAESALRVAAQENG